MSFWKVVECIIFPRLNHPFPTQTGAAQHIIEKVITGPLLTQLMELRISFILLGQQVCPCGVPSSFKLHWPMWNLQRRCCGSLTWNGCSFPYKVSIVISPVQWQATENVCPWIFVDIGQPRCLQNLFSSVLYCIIIFLLFRKRNKDNQKINK
jgi:hypothetical protein